MGTRLWIGILGVAPFGLLVAKAVWLWSNWEVLPAKYPVHWGIHGPDRWVYKSPGAVFGMVLLVGLVCASLVGAAAGMAFGMGTSVAEAIERPRKIGIAGMLALAVLIALALPPVNGWLSVPYAGLGIGAIAFAMVIALIAAKSGGECEPAGLTAHSAEAWKWGLFYYNPGDPALFVEKKHGVGWTLNFANRWSWAYLALPLATVLTAVLALR